MTQSQDILGLDQPDIEEIFEHSYGKQPIHNFMTNSVKGTRNNLQSNHWQTNFLSNDSNRGHISAKNLHISGHRNDQNSLLNSSSSMSTTHKKGTFKINIKQSGLPQTPIARE